MESSRCPLHRSSSWVVFIALWMIRGWSKVGTFAILSSRTIGDLGGRNEIQVVLHLVLIEHWQRSLLMHGMTFAYYSRHNSIDSLFCFNSSMLSNQFFKNEISYLPLQRSLSFPSKQSTFMFGIGTTFMPTQKIEAWANKKWWRIKHLVLKELGYSVMPTKRSNA